MCHGDISLVPTQDLPLQTVLTFEACAPELAASYLQAMCFQEDDYLLNRETLVRLYNNSAPQVGNIDFPDIPHPATRGDFPSADLRRTMNGLQFLCASASRNSGWEPDEDREDGIPNRKSADQDAELVSYMETYLKQGPWDTREVSFGYGR